ncbi:MAG: efflux transporter outer membrane subunit [Desulfobacterales bacterium]|nr:efflux transporter outer membrane subunit [Desulfobacterales bacterium]
MRLNPRKIIIDFLLGSITLFAALILSGCAAVGPDYLPPDPTVLPAWHTPLEGGLTPGDMDPQMLANWWTTLNDPELSSLIERAVAGNLNLKKAGAKVREARARRGISRADLFPTLDATGSATRSRGSEETGGGNTRELYAAGFDAGWEVDIFGGLRRSVEAAEANLQASREGLRDVLVSLVSEVALNYVEARTYQARLAVAEANLKAQQETCELTRWRYEAGLSDELALEQARYNLESTRSQIPTLRSGLEEAKNRLAVLLGERPGMIHTELEERKPIPVTPLEVAVGVPADTLRRRPDIRKAERELAAQTARIGVATADLYPRFTLKGSIGLEALSPGNWISYGSRSSSIGPRVSWAVFDAGAIRKNIEVQSALQEQALIQYETALLSALEEVENALVAYANEQGRRQSLLEASQAAQRAAKLARDRYAAGLIDFQVVLDAERSLLNLQSQMAESDGKVTSNLIALYKALGGGWTSLTVDDKTSILVGERK